MRHLGHQAKVHSKAKELCSRKFLLEHCRQDDADERSMCYLLSGRHATLPGASCKLQAVLPYDSSDEQILRTVQSNAYGWSGQ